MSLIFESPSFKQNPSATATHVLLIGCGDYPSIAAVGYGNLKQLTSPRLSAEAMAEWFLSGVDAMPPGQGLPPEKAFYNPDAPLGSLAMLVSPSKDYQSPAGDVKPSLRPTLANIEDAYLQWIKRLGDNPNNRGVFYFCGHGVSNGINQYLVADDFGDNIEKPWSTVFHVSNTCQATIRKTPAKLFYLIDACMEFSEDLLDKIDNPHALIEGSRKGTPKTKEWPLLCAATTNQKAYAPEGGVAYFTAAILQALRGYCGSQRAGVQLFDVTASKLRDATAAFLAISPSGDNVERQKMGSPQGDGDWNISLHVLNKRPAVLVKLDVDPQGFRPVARAFVEKENSTTPRPFKPLIGGPVQFIVDRGEWTYGANAANNEFQEQVFPRQFLSEAVHTYCFLIP